MTLHKTLPDGAQIWTVLGLFLDQFPKQLLVVTHYTISITDYMEQENNEKHIVGSDSRYSKWAHSS